jgi:nucleoid-associated protein YgaU
MPPLYFLTSDGLRFKLAATLAEKGPFRHGETSGSRRIAGQSRIRCDRSGTICRLSNGGYLRLSNDQCPFVANRHIMPGRPTIRLKDAIMKISRMVLLFLVLVAAGAAGGLALVYPMQHVRREPQVEAKTAAAAPADAKPASNPKDNRDNKGPDALAAAESETGKLAAALAGPSSPAKSEPGLPEFDVARIEPTGEAVIAGRAAPGATVELLRNGEVHDRAVVDSSGQFAMVPPKLPPGTYDLTLRSRLPDGREATSQQRVAVALEAVPNQPPMVALMTPDKPSRVLSQPAAPGPSAGSVIVETVEIEPGGKLHVSGRASAGASVRLYLNDSFVEQMTAGADGRLATTVNKAVAPGGYQVRLDEVESNSGTVRARAEVPFNVPDTGITASVPSQTPAAKRADVAAIGQSKLAAANATVLPDGRSSAAAAPPSSTTTVTRGDSLWRISQRALGAGTRYAVIYNANRKQIRNPNRIYPGQVFVLPAR